MQRALFHCQASSCVMYKLHSQVGIALVIKTKVSIEMQHWYSSGMTSHATLDEKTPVQEGKSGLKSDNGERC